MSTSIAKPPDKFVSLVLTHADALHILQTLERPTGSKSWDTHNLAIAAFIRRELARSREYS